jgi:Type I phosphodiesterase / nucleotide pyrophosphatase
MLESSQSETLAGLGQSIFSALGFTESENFLKLPESKRTALVLIDGLGLNALNAYCDQFPIFKELTAHNPLNAHFPTTTATNLVSLGTGVNPGVHAMLGYTVRVPRSGEPGRLLNALKWDARVDPLTWQKIPTLYERALSEGFNISHIAEKRYEGSGFTQAGMRGAHYIGANRNTEIIQAAKAAHQQEKSYSYIYLNVVDSAGHAHGVGSDRWLAALGSVAELLEGLISTLPREMNLYLTADHGMINVEEKVVLGEGNSLLENVTLIGGEARARHIYLRSGSEDESAQAWREFFGAKVDIFTKSDAQQLFGDVISEDSRDRMGDLIAVPRENIVLLDPEIASKESLMVGHHGGFTQDEVRIPLLSYRT